MISATQLFAPISRLLSSTFCVWYCLWTESVLNINWTSVLLCTFTSPKGTSADFLTRIKSNKQPVLRQRPINLYCKFLSHNFRENIYYLERWKKNISKGILNLVIPLGTIASILVGYIFVFSIWYFAIPWSLSDIFSKVLKRKDGN